MKPRDEWKPLRQTLLHRLLGVYLALILWSLLIAARLVQLQIFDSQEYRLQARQQQIGFVELSARRGDILDRHLDALAISVEVDSLSAHPREIPDPLLTARALAPVLEQDPRQLFTRLKTDRPFLYLARRLTPQQAKRISRMKLPGIYLGKEPRRYYPGEELAAHLLGFVGVDNEGLSGLEYRYNNLIQGRKTRVHLRFDAHRQRLQSDPGPEPSEGNIIVLSVDRAIQYIVQQVLEKTVLTTHALNGSAIVMDPNTGEVLALASYPFFNPNRYRDFSPQERRNRAILDIYEPGSTFKMITFAGVLDRHLGRPGEIINCRVGSLRIAGKVYHEAEHTFQELTLEQVLARSSNVGTIKLGLRLGPEGLYHYIRAFGFGRKTGIDLPGEQAGLLRPPSQWSKISIGALSIGQEIGVTPIQLVRAASAIANGGYLVQPQVVRRVLSPAGVPILETSPRRSRILDPATSRQLKHALSLVVSEGTGRAARLEGYSAAGKTGTAQKFVAGRYAPDRHVASFVGFSPLEHPALAAIVVINEPKGVYYGGHVAAPAFKEIMERSLIHLRVPRDQPLPPPSPERHRELAASAGDSIQEKDFAGEELERTILSLMQGEDTPPSNAITVETRTFPVPDFTGQSLRQVARECARLGLRLKVSGAGLAVGQRPAAGQRALKGAVCEVFFAARRTHAIAETPLPGRNPLARGGR